MSHWLTWSRRDLRPTAASCNRPIEMFWLNFWEAVKSSIFMYSQWVFNVICMNACVCVCVCLHGCTSDTRPADKAPFRRSRSLSWRHCGWRREWRHRRATIVTLFGVSTTTPRFSEEWLVAPAQEKKKKKEMHECGMCLWYKCLETK